MIPKKIKPYFKTMLQKEDGENRIVEGLLTCCNDHAFEVLIVGKIKQSILFKACLFPENDTITLEVRCKKCGKVIQVFDSVCDGYEHCKKIQHTQIVAKPINCKKCQENDFSVIIKYEYPNAQELENLEITEIDNAFTWIWVTLKCNKCGAKYKNFIDYETS